ncbi:MAG: M1 family metallopeptidase [Sphingobacteriia bacterium]|nr:M1 family metallopeptidase [Sphingobacteriia bacterium]
MKRKSYAAIQNLVRHFILSKKILSIVGMIILIAANSNAQLLSSKTKKYTHADTLRGSLNENRDWWDVLRYDITVKPDYENKTIEGVASITFKTSSDLNKQKHIRYLLSLDTLKMQIDLQQPLQIDSIFINDSITVAVYDYATTKSGYRGTSHLKLNFKRENNAAILSIPSNQLSYSENNLVIYYHGKPREAVRPPWDGGWIWKKDASGNPWMSVACQGLGASVWYPCKDHQSDEPDNGASLTMIVPDTLIAVANGRLYSKSPIPNSKSVSYTWQVKNPINNYNIVPYIGKYVNFTDTLMGEKGKLDLSYWVLKEDSAKAVEQFKQVKPMIRAFEYWFGPYPFYEDSYKLVEAPHLGMEHQSAVAYGNRFQNGYLGRDLSGTGWGLKWDFIIVHESGHEWFANNITTKDIADMWVHEGFTNYSETLYTEYYYGKEAGNDYNYGIRKNIRNDIPIIGDYGVNNEGSGDMYYKASNMLHAIRHSINNDELFRDILRGLNKTFYHQTVTTQQIENYISREAGFNYQKVFDQYLRTTQIPTLDLKIDSANSTIQYRYSNCVEGFNLPLIIYADNKIIKLKPTTNWITQKVKAEELSLLSQKLIERLYYLKVNLQP